MAQKFIITNTCKLRFGNVNLHKDLLERGEDCLGGGMYEFDYTQGRMLLYGKSFDYGRPAWQLIDVLEVPESLSGLEITYEDVSLQDFVKISFT